MNKADIVESVHGVLQGTKKSAEEAVEMVFESITKSLSKGQEVSISGFGTFVVKKRAARQGINPRTGEKIHIKATTTPKFRAGKNLKDAVK
jgi:DNA-binding protein HU-beta